MKKYHYNYLKLFGFLLALCLALCIFASCGAVTYEDPDEDPTKQEETKADKDTSVPVITGTKESFTVYADDSFDAVITLLLEGVQTLDGEKCEVKADILSANGEKVEALTEGTYTVKYYCDRADVKAVNAVLNVKPADTTPPVIEGVKNKIVYLGDTVSYREGVTVTDNEDTSVQLQVDASKVDLTKLGTYPLFYSAVDKRGNSASVSATVMVISSPNADNGQSTEVCTKEELDDLCRKILNQIINDNMTDYEKAQAIYNRVRQIRYVSTSSKDSWISGAYTGLTTGRGDCFNYYAASKALLTLADIPNYDLERKGGNQPHYWQLVYVNDGWYHFDACPTLDVYPIRCFLYTEEEVAAYTKAVAWACPEYYVYDYDKCPYDVVQSRK